MMRVLIVAFFAACFATPAYAQHGADYCFADSSTLVLFDRTTPLDAGDTAAIRTSLGALVDGLHGGERIVIATIESHYSLSRETFAGCVPACPPNNGPFGVCSPLRAQREARVFRGRLFNAVQALLRSGPEQAQSDITGTIARQTRRRAYTRLVLYSDMLENSQALPWRTFGSSDTQTLMQSVDRFGLQPSVRGARISIAGFGRTHDPDRHALSAETDARVRGFWSLYFRRAGAHEPTYE